MPDFICVERCCRTGLNCRALSSESGGTILFKRFAPGTDLVVGNGVQTLAGGLALAPLAFTFESVSDIVSTWRFVGAMAYVILCSSVAAVPSAPGLAGVRVWRLMSRGRGAMDAATAAGSRTCCLSSSESADAGGPENPAPGLASKTAKLDRVRARGKPRSDSHVPGTFPGHSHSIPMR